MSASSTPSRLPVVFTLCVLAAMVTTLAYVRFVLLPAQQPSTSVEFHLTNPLLDARVGDRVLFVNPMQPGVEACIVVREPGLVLRPHKGPDRVGTVRDLKRQPAYLACSLREVRPNEGGCGGADTEMEVVLYGANFFGMQVDHKVAVQSIQPRIQKWGDREIVVYKVALQGYGPNNSRYTTYLSEDAAVSGLIYMQRLTPTGVVQKYTFREMLVN